jgi:2-polyprenyl-6-methoxyphenol hydroxylase-like FAD-dependent oxidoreductase
MSSRADSGTGTRRPLRHAVVLGGSMAGLLAARVLSEHFERVTVIERDDDVHGARARKGVPQGNHLHAFLARGRMIAEALFPGLCEDLVTAGAVRVNAGRELAWHQCGGWRVGHDSDISFLSMSRPCLESQVAERVRALRNVTMLHGARVMGLRFDGGGVTGIRLARPGSLMEADEVDADLVVDAMGRGTPAPQWLTELGIAAPHAELVGARVSYTTCTFRRTSEGPGWRALIIAGRPAPRSGLIFPIEGDRWLVTLASFSDERMPQDREGFEAFARSLSVPDLYEMIRGSEPTSQMKQYKFCKGLRRRFERLEQTPEGLIAIGDSVCSFNPVYGQGMTVAAIESEVLGQALAAANAEGGIGPDFGRRWFRLIAPVIDAAWRGATLEDFRVPELAAQRPLHLAPLQWYMERVQRATHRSAFVADQFYRVMNFLEPPTRLFRPRVITEVLLPIRSGMPRGTSARETPVRHGRSTRKAA